MLASWGCVTPGLVDASGQWWCNNHRDMSKFDAVVVVALLRHKLPVDVVRRVLSLCRTASDPAVMHRNARQEYVRLHGCKFAYHKRPRW